MQPSVDLRRALESVLWIGGAPDSGKTTVSRILGDRHGFEVYHFDRHEMEHFSQAHPVRHPALWAAHPDRMSTEQRWLGMSPEEMAASTMASWGERCWMAFEDLSPLAARGPVIAEGPGFFPGILLPILTDNRKAVWLVPDEGFKRRSALARGKPGNKHETSDPDRAAANLIARDLIMGRRIREACATRDLTCLIVGGPRNVDAVIATIEEQFASWL